MASKYRALKLACVLLIFRSAAALAINRTIDDQFGDSATGALPIYSPENMWAQGNQCSTCFAQPDYQQTFDHTWHDATIHSGDSESELNVTMTFSGTAIYAYCIIVNNNTYTTFTNLTFSIDGAQVGSYSHSPDGSNTYLYNTLVYANASVPNGNHTFVIHSPRGANDSFVLFDYVQYTYNPDSTASSASSPSASTTSSSAKSSTSPKTAVGAIAGGTVAAVVVLALVAAAMVFLCCRRRKLTTERTSYTSFDMLSMPQWQSTEQLAGYESHSDVRQSFHQHSSGRSPSQHPLPFVVSNPDTFTDGEVSTPNGTELRHQLEDHQRRLAELQGRSSKQQPPSEVSESTVQSQVEDLRLEVARLREMMANLDTTAPPEYHD